MKAYRMFNDLFYYEVYMGSDYILYVKSWDNAKYKDEILFDLKNKNVSTNIVILDSNGEKLAPSILTIDEIQAIYTQMKELGWK